MINQSAWNRKAWGQKKSAPLAFKARHSLVVQRTEFSVFLNQPPFNLVHLASFRRDVKEKGHHSVNYVFINITESHRPVQHASDFPYIGPWHEEPTTISNANAIDEHWALLDVQHFGFGVIDGKSGRLNASP